MERAFSALLRLAVLTLSATAASAHSIWLEKAPNGFQAFFGEVESGERDSLKPELRFGSATVQDRTGKPVAFVLEGVRLSIPTTSTGIRLRHDAMPVHGEGPEAGRAVFTASALAKGATTPDSAWRREPLELRGDSAGVRILLRGAPAPGHEASLLSPDGKSNEVRADESGLIALPGPGRWLVSAWTEEAGSGVHEGKSYARTWHVATLSLEPR